MTRKEPQENSCELYTRSLYTELLFLVSAKLRKLCVLHQSRDWLGRTSPNWPTCIMCGVGHMLDSVTMDRGWTTENILQCRMSYWL